MTNPNLYIGLMSGTSTDGIDAALVNFSNNTIELVAQHEIALSPDIKQQILQLCAPSDNEIDRMGALDRQLGLAFAHASQALLNKANVNAKDITAIGSHGQTIRHRPENAHSFTLQIGDPNTIAETTAITTVSDFRRRDIAAGGQGAPLAPAFHSAAFHNSKHSRAIVNIGGMSNISYLPLQGEVIGFDTGPGNVLMDAWIDLHQGKSYDHNGQWAAAGNINKALLKGLLAHPYFQQLPPKSTGREAFNLDWLQSTLLQQKSLVPPADVQATLLELTAYSIASDIKALATESMEVYICGGGAFNLHLMQALKRLLADHKVDTTAALGIAPEWVEAVAFAWLAKQTIEKKTGNLPSVTGAAHAVPLGGIYIA